MPQSASLAHNMNLLHLKAKVPEDIPCGGKYESTNSGATKSVPLLKNERTNYVRFPIIAHEKQWALAVITRTNP